MRLIAVCLVLGLPLSACAAGPARLVENGVPRGSLAVAAIDRGDLKVAEELLLASTLDGEDPARLINLGYVYMEQGRQAEALRTWRAALNARRHHAVETMGGREVRTDHLAREILSRYEPSFASAD